MCWSEILQPNNYTYYTLLLDLLPIIPLFIFFELGVLYFVQIKNSKIYSKT